MVKKLKEKGFSTCIKTVETKKETANIKVGDKVKLNKGAKVYGTNKTFQDWVYTSTLYVRSINGEKVVISTQKTGDVTGTVSKSDLVKA